MDVKFRQMFVFHDGGPLLEMYVGYLAEIVSKIWQTFTGTFYAKSCGKTSCFIMSRDVNYDNLNLYSIPTIKLTMIL